MPFRVTFRDTVFLVFRVSVAGAGRPALVGVKTFGGDVSAVPPPRRR